MISLTLVDFYAYSLFAGMIGFGLGMAYASLKGMAR